MQRAKGFFFVCAGVFLLALSYHLAASSASAQIGALVQGASIQSIAPYTFPRATACVNRVWRWMGESGGLHTGSVPVPGAAPIVATDPYGTVILENGDWLKFDGSSWVLIGNLVGGGPIPAKQESWGQLKARYR